MIKLSVATSKKNQLIDITAKVQQAVTDNPFSDGLCLVYVPHTTAAVTINENADPDVRTDILMSLSKYFPMDPSYRHSEGNSDAHLKSSLVGASETIIVHHGLLTLGQWQSVFFCEFDGPRNRHVYLQLIGEGAFS